MRLLTIGLLLLVTASVYAGPEIGGLPGRALPVRGLPTYGIPAYGAASPPAAPVTSNAMARFIALFGMILLLLGVGIHNGIMLRAILAEMRIHRPAPMVPPLPPEIVEARKQLDEYLSGPPDPPKELPSG